MRTTAAAAIAGALSIGLATPTTADAATVGIHVSIGSHVDREARFALPAPKRLTGPDDGTAPLTVHVTQRSICAGTTKCVAFSGTGVPGQTVVVTYEVTKDPLFGDRGAAGITTVSEKVDVDGTGNWSLNTEFPNAVVTKDAAGTRSVAYHVVESDDVLTLVATARFAGAIPIR
ncbi:hypothetical protein ITJ44_10805 [Clavibacter sp. VKM Ac-2873]|uniref:hypothetical protein n=1 Tax=Clavibacter sp. VKM Ac-2873 TaxID=2783813 RepID=UPI00188A58A6|nr:hypothetical protein [Clavibacter sp. VKM Ac-2873]MBF4618561.1 hypothetical protein [Clavibacter sp. VKM Ac-2873]